MPITLTSNPNLEVVDINDFTPGMVNGADSFSVFSSTAPVGSASNVYRCYARPNVGLVPLPISQAIRTVQPANPWCAYHMGQGSPAVDGVIVLIGSSPTVTGTSILYDVQPGAANILYTGAGGALTLPIGPNLDTFFTTGGPLAGLPSWDFIDAWVTPSPVWVRDAGGAGGGIQQVVLTTVPGSAVEFTSATARAVFMGGFSGLQTSDIYATTNISALELFAVERTGVAGIAAWGSISTGEFLIVYASGGGVVINGDIQNPSSAIFLPGILGPGAAVGPALSTPQGLIYPTDTNGAQLWNGGNTTEKISLAIPDNKLIRPQPFAQVTCQSCNAMLGQFALFPNNLVYDTVTGGWWQLEDPTVQVFNLYAKSIHSPGTVYSLSPDHGANNTVPFTTYKFSFSRPASSYRWISNPLPFPGAIISLQEVEICASNPTATTATIKITPTAPPGQTPYPNQNPSQSVTFTIPPFTTAYRADKPLGWTDYNVCIQVDAVNSNGNNAAPTLHEVLCGISRSTAAVTN